MTNKILFIANWKMFGDLNSVKSIQSVINLSKKKNYKNAKIIYCPPYTLLNYFVIKTRKTNLDVGAQNCHYEINTGPYTGSISSTMIKKLGAKYVIIGHSENRSNGETNTQINKKIHSAILNNLNVIFCIGENLFEKKNKKTNKILKKQIDIGLKKIKKIDKIIFAYEPVWSIGTGPRNREQRLRSSFPLWCRTLCSGYLRQRPRRGIPRGVQDVGTARVPR